MASLENPSRNMNKTSPTTARRILVACDASLLGLAAVEAATRLAAELQAELQGLFVEDINLLRLAELPFAREIAYASAVRRPLDFTVMERSLRAKAEEVRQALADSAHRVSVEWSFTVKRGHVTRAMLEAASAADLLITGRESSPLAALPPPRSGTQKNHIVVVYDGTRACERALQAASTLARLTADAIMIIVAANDPNQADQLRGQCQDLCQSLKLSVQWDPQLVADPVSLADAARRWQARVLFINRDSSLLDEPAIDRLIRQLECPVTLVR
jgi:nucleotide-binding universal stress UspA family protein